jgi:hypothetical protein
MDLNLTGQGLERDQIAPKLQSMKSLMLDRKVIWDKLPYSKKKKWIQAAATKDPIMDIAWDVYTWLRDNFFEETDRDDDI